jgi:hypothetical protein
MNIPAGVVQYPKAEDVILDPFLTRYGISTGMAERPELQALRFLG